MTARRRTDRGQTTQDYAVGIGLFLLVVVFALTFLPGILAPFGTIDQDQREAQAERVADTLVDRALLEDGRVHLNWTALEDQLAVGDLPSTVGLSGPASVNVTVEHLGNETTVLTGGRTYDGQNAGTWTRLVTADERCADGCRLVVRVW